MARDRLPCCFIALRNHLVFSPSCPAGRDHPARRTEPAAADAARSVPDAGHGAMLPEPARRGRAAPCAGAHRIAAKPGTMEASTAAATNTPIIAIASR